MKKFFAASLSVLSILVGVSGGQETFAPPFELCWGYPTEELSSFEIASDNDSRIFVPLVKGNLQSLELKTGALLWKTELGGEIATNIFFRDGVVYAAVRDTPENASVLTVRALSSSTGIAVWQKDFQMNNNEKFRLSANKFGINLISTKGRIHTIEAKTGELKSSIDLKSEIGLPPADTELDQEFVLISNSGSTFELNRYSAQNGARLNSLKMKNGSRILYSGKESILTSDLLGNVSLYSAWGYRRSWTVRTGAEVDEVLETNNGFMLSSKDNFVYFVSKRNGRRIWKVRLPYRVFATLFDTGIGVFSSAAGNESILIESAGGKIVGRLKIADENYFNSKPIVQNGFFIAPTAMGVYGYKQSGC